MVGSRYLEVERTFDYHIVNNCMDSALIETCRLIPGHLDLMELAKLDFEPCLSTFIPD